MSWPQLKPFEGLMHLKKGRPALDVRSPGEFIQGHIPGFTNIAILDDDHRQQVGLAYKKLGNEKAVELGHQLVDPLRSVLVSSWRQSLARGPALVTCWRGGLRSTITAQWLAESGAEGVRAEGGYKALRHLLMEEIETPREWVVLGGLTGSGKTEVLKQLPAHGVLDLEDLAKHRGSAFGGYVGEPQPSQQTFENAIGLHMFDNCGLLIVENESSMVGHCAVPPLVRAAIRNSPLVRLQVTLEQRVARVFDEYVVQPLRLHPRETVRDTLLSAIFRIAKKLGGVRAGHISGLIGAAFKAESASVEDHRPWIESLFKEYYDPMYEYGLQRDQRKILFKGTLPFLAVAESI